MQAARNGRAAVDGEEVNMALNRASIEVIRGGQVLASAEGEREASLLYAGGYLPGDEIVFTSATTRAVVQVDQLVAPARVFLPEGRFVYRPPVEGDGLAVYPPHAFAGEGHLLSISPDEANEYRNLAANPADQRGEVLAFPHATANVETRNESAFAARNVIDGVHIAAGHGQWPYGSWGIGARTDAELTLDFGRTVEIDALALYLRADFPHDAYWTQATVTLDDGFECTFGLQGIDGAQRVALDHHRVRSLKLHRLIKCDMPSAFPALRQIEVYGRDIED